MKAQRFLIAADSHGDMIDPDARRAFIEFKKHWKPSLVIHAGDWMDLRALRRGASEEEANEGVKADIEAGVDFVREIGTKVLLWGNHDNRLVRQLRNGHGRSREYSTLLYNALLDRIGTNVTHIPYGKRLGVYQLGDLRVVHGYHSGIYAARQAAATYGRVLMGHVHCNSVFDQPSLDRATGYTVGALCNLDMEYTESQCATLRWSAGFAYGLLLPTGETTVWLAQKVAGRWILPSEFKSL